MAREAAGGVGGAEEARGLLGVVYDRLLYYLNPDQEFRDDVAEWENRWREHVNRQDWPRFRVAESKLVLSEGLGAGAYWVSPDAEIIS